MKMEKRPYDSKDDSYSSQGEKYPRTDSYSSRGDSSYSSRGGGGDSYGSKSSSNSYSSHDNNSSSWQPSSRNSYNSRDSGSGGGYSSREGGGSSYGYSRSDSNSYSSSRYGSSGGGRGYSSSDNGSYRSRGRGSNSWGRGGGRGGYSQNEDSWNCSSCRFSNYASRTSCYKCKNPKDAGGGSSHRSWDSNKKSSWGDSKYSRNGNGRDSSYSNSWKKDGGKDDGLIDWDDLAKNEAKYEAERWSHLAPIVKDLYKEDPAVAAMSEDEVRQFRQDSFNMQVNCLNKERAVPIPNPVKTFEQAFASFPMILSEIKRQGFDAPSPIQAQAWPILMKGYDMIGTSQTGSGKTLAFLLPALLHIVAQSTPRWERVGPSCLVLAPTRELAQQIEREVNKIHFDNIRCVCCYGQGDRRSQLQKLNAMAEIVIATPGRLNDFVEQGSVNLSGISYLVLDEADRMLDMGFEPQVRKIIINIRPDRQTILTSATWPVEVRQFADKLLKDPIHVVVGSLDLQAVDTITQHVCVCSIMEKDDKLIEFLREMKPEDKAIIFVAQKITVDHLSVKLMESGFAVESMHGGRNQRDREYSLRQLKTGRSKILIATDVASRGIDINDVTHVLNYDCPKDMEEYVHRVGRTGRAGRSGQSLTLMCRDDWKVAGQLIEILEKSGQEIPHGLVRMKERWDRVKEERGDQPRSRRYGYGGPGGGGGGGGRNGWYNA